MAAIHGAGAVVYLSPGTGEAVQVAEQVDYSIELDADIQDTTALGSAWGSAVKGTNKWTGSLSGNFDTGSKTLWSAGTSTASQKFYLYPVAATTTLYYYGMVFVKLGKAIAGGVTAKATSGCSLVGAGQLACQ